MSQYSAGKYLYGFDPVIPEYFLMEDLGDDVKVVVGVGSPKYGSKGNLLTAIRNLGLTIPAEHNTAIMMDLPF